LVRQIVRKITPWLDVSFVECSTYEDWKNWLVPEKHKQILEGVHRLHNPPSSKNVNHHVVTSILKQYQIRPLRDLEGTKLDDANLVGAIR
ncbi:hypothetical protein Tco_1451398, partial [Tanacetum coccineum]